MSPSMFLERMNAAVSPKSPSGRIMKNVVVISVAFMIQFTAFQSMAALQSSINKVGTNTCTMGYKRHLIRDSYRVTHHVVPYPRFC